MWATWNNKTEECEMSINKDDDLHGWLGLTPTNKQREMCPNGVWEEGLVQDRVYHESGYYVGPCWRAFDWRATSLPWWLHFR